MKPCKHLDYSLERYGGQCDLITAKEDPRLSGFPCEVKYWRRKFVPYDGAPINVQFCGKGRGRINEIFACYNPGEMFCHEAEDTSGRS